MRRMGTREPLRLGFKRWEDFILISCKPRKVWTGQHRIIDTKLQPSDENGGVHQEQGTHEGDRGSGRATTSRKLCGKGRQIATVRPQRIVGKMWGRGREGSVID